AARNEPWVRRPALRPVPDRPALRPDGRRAAEEVGRPAPRVPRLEPRIAQVPALQPGPDLPRPGTGEADRGADLPRGSARRRPPDREAGTPREEPHGPC